MNEVRALLGKLLAFSPFISYAPLGLYGAWAFMLCSGTSWVSRSEANGLYISILYVTVSICAGAALVAFALFGHRFPERCHSPRTCLLGSFVSFAGCALVILDGPFYFAPYFGTGLSLALFIIGSMLAGIGLAPGLLLCASAYSKLKPRRVLLYVSLSYILAPVLYFMLIGLPTWAPVEGGPSLAGISFFCLLPVAAACLLCLPSFVGVDAGSSKEGESSDCKDKSETIVPARPTQDMSASTSRSAEGVSRSPIFARRPPDHALYWRFAAAFFLCTLAVYAVRGSAVMPSDIIATFESTRVMMLSRIVVALGIFLFSIGSAAEFERFGKAYSIVVVATSSGVALLPVFPISAITTSALVCLFASVFEMALWVSLAYLVIQRRVESDHVFGFAYGGYLVTCGSAWALGAFVLSSIDGARAALFSYVMLAALVLLGAFILFSERDFSRIFAAKKEGETTIVEMIQNEELFALEASHGEQESGLRRGYFRPAVDQLAEEFKLSKRETDVFRCLAMGYDANAVAERLGVSWNTVRTHMRNVYGKLGVHSKQELMDVVDARIEQLKKPSLA